MQGSTNPPQSQGSPRSASQQWDRFEVALSKPSGRQKLGMVLKHAQIVGEDKVKRGAYLASLAEGPSVAQDLGLSPKDRLISVEGLDVKTLPFDRIVALIRKASFPLTLVWSRQRKDGVTRNLPGTVVGLGAQRAVGNRPDGTLATKVSEPAPAPAPSPDAAAGGAGRESDLTETSNGEAEAVSSSTSTVDANKERQQQRTEEKQEKQKDGRQHSEEQQQQQQQQPQQTLPEATPAAVAIGGGDKGGSIGENVADNRGVYPEEGTRIVDRSKSSADENGNSNTTSNTTSGNGGVSSANSGGGINLADVAEDWIRATSRGRAVSRATREAESLGGEGRGYEMRRASAGMIQGADHARHHRARLEQQLQLQRKRQINIPMVGSIRQQQQQQPEQYGSIATHPRQQPIRPGLRHIQGVVQGTSAASGANMGGGRGTLLQNLYLGHSHRHQQRQLQQQRGSVHPVSEATASAVAEVLSHQGIVPTTIARQQSSSWLQGNHNASINGNGNIIGGSDGGGVVEGGGSGMKGMSERDLEEEELKASKERKVEIMKARRRERDKARREKIRREAAAGDTDRMLHEGVSFRQQQQLQQLSRPQGGTFGKGKRSIHGRSNSVIPGGAVGAGAEVGGDAPDWLNPLIKAELGEFIGTRYCRSRLKQTLCREWLRQEYRNGIALGQVDKNMPEIEFMQRRMAGGSLYALLEQESKDYLRAGAFTDADVELIGKNFAHAVSSNGELVNASGTRELEVSWADHLRNFQIDVPSTSYDLTASDDQEHSDVGVVAVGGVKVGGPETKDGAWDGRGVDASVVIKHRRRFDARCCAYEALNSSSRNDKTSSLLNRTQRLYQDHANFIVAKRTTLEGTLENVRSQLRHREERLHHLRLELSRVNPMDAAAVAALAENKAVIVNRISEKELQMSMILEEVNKVIDWEHTTELARREAMQHAADVHGHGGASAEEAARERGELVQAMMSQKATLVLLSTFWKLHGPWLAPNGHVRRHPSSAAATSNTATAAAASNRDDGNAVRVTSEESSGVSSSADKGNGRRGTQSSSMSRVCNINNSSIRSNNANCSSPRDVEKDSIVPERQPFNGRPQTAKPKPLAKKPEQKIKSIKLRLRPPSSKDEPVIGTWSNATASGQGAKATTTTADEGGGRRNGVEDIGDSSASSRRRSSLPEITASTTVSSSSQRAPWDSSSCMAAVMARGGKEAAMARLAGERRAAEEAAAVEQIAIEVAVSQDEGADDGDDCGTLETAPCHRRPAEGEEEEGVDGRSGGGSSGSATEGADIGGEGSNTDDPMGDGDPAPSIGKGSPMEDSIGPLSFESVGSSSPCSSQRMETLCFDEDDAAAKNERDGDDSRATKAARGYGDSQFGDSGEM